MSRLHNEAKRLSREAHRAEPFERYLADALPEIAAGGGKPGRTEMVILVSQGVADRDWQDVRDDEHCKIPGVGPIAPQIAKRIAEGDAFLTGLFFERGHIDRSRAPSSLAWRHARRDSIPGRVDQCALAGRIYVTSAAEDGTSPPRS